MVETRSSGSAHTSDIESSIRRGIAAREFPCPHCASKDLATDGHAKNILRLKCRTCSKTCSGNRFIPSIPSKNRQIVSIPATPPQSSPLSQRLPSAPTNHRSTPTTLPTNVTESLHEIVTQLRDEIRELREENRKLREELKRPQTRRRELPPRRGARPPRLGQLPQRKAEFLESTDPNSWETVVLRTRRTRYGALRRMFREAGIPVQTIVELTWLDNDWLEVVTTTKTPLLEGLSRLNEICPTEIVNQDGEELDKEVDRPSLIQRLHRRVDRLKEGPLHNFIAGRIEAIQKNQKKAEKNTINNDNITPETSANDMPNTPPDGGDLH